MSRILSVILLFVLPVVAFANSTPEGVEPQIDYPADQWFANIGSHVGRHLGMCVFSSFEMSMRNAGIEEFRGFRDWCASNYEGGGDPEKLARLVKAYCRAKSIPVSVFDPDKEIVQFEGSPQEAASIMEKALHNGYMPCCTLSHSPRYQGTIAHMVNCPHMDSHWGAVMDNNAIGLKGGEYEWQTREKMIGEMTEHTQQGPKIWTVIILRPGAPPSPSN